MTTKLPTVKNGDTWNFQFVWTNNSTPINLTECTAKMQIRDKDGALIATASSALSNITITGSTGTVNVTFSAAVTAPIPAGSYKSDLQLTFPDTTVQSSSTVIITVEAGITE
jgi:flagellar basal body P-ring protein FlgI